MFRLAMIARSTMGRPATPAGAVSRVSASVRAVPFLALLLAGADSAFGQRLLHVVPPGESAGAAAETAARASASEWTVEVDHDLVRSDPSRLEFEAPDGRELAVLRSVFEDRGDGNAMWMGRYPGNEWDSVVLTVQDGHLLGHFGLPEGGAYSIRAPGDGAGRMDEIGMSRVRCGVSTSRDPDEPPPVARRQAAAPRDPAPPRLGDPAPRDPAPRDPAPRDPAPGEIVSETNHRTLDILVLYTPSAARSLAQNGYGRPKAAMQQAMDYLNMVFRNSRFTVAGRMVHLAEAPTALEEAIADANTKKVIGIVSKDAAIQALRAKHRADVVHLFVGVNTGYCGLAELLTRTHTPADFAKRAYAITVVHQLCVEPRDEVKGGWFSFHLDTFAHEVAHNLGAHHDPDNAEENAVDFVVEPYAFGHQDTSRRPNVRTVMSYNDGRGVPFFSNARVRPLGATIGIAGERENERALARTIHLGVQYSDFLAKPPDPGGGDGTFTDCVPTAAQIAFAHGYTVGMCVEYPQGGQTVTADAKDYGLRSAESGLLYFFDRDNVEVLVKVLDACKLGAAGNGHRWVYVAPLTDLAFNLHVTETASGKRWTHRNPRGGRTASTKSDPTAFPCPAAGASGASAEGPASADNPASATAARPIMTGEASTCAPRPALTLRDGSKVALCVEFRRDGKSVVIGATDFGLESDGSGLLYFFDRNNVEMLVKVLNDCSAAGYRWVGVAPVTDLAFNLKVTTPEGRTWTHSNPLGQTATAKRGTIPCSAP